MFAHEFIMSFAVIGILAGGGSAGHPAFGEEAEATRLLDEILSAVKEKAPFDISPGVVAFRPNDRINELMTRYARKGVEGVEAIDHRIKDGKLDNMDAIVMIETLSKIKNAEAGRSLQRLLAEAKAGKGVFKRDQYPSTPEIVNYLEAKMRQRADATMGGDK